MFWYGSMILFLSMQNVMADSIKINFDDIPKMVRERNLHVQGAEFRYKAAQQGQGYLARSYLPRLSAEIGRENFKTGTQADRTESYGSVRANINVFRGGRDRLENLLARSRFQLSQVETDRLTRDEILKTRTLYWNLISQREVIQLLQKAQDENQKHLVSAQKRIRAGQATETDRLEFEMRKVELDQDLSRLSLASENTERDLGILLGLAENSKIETPLMVGHEHTDELLNENFDRMAHPEVVSTYLQSEQSKLKGQQAARWWTPSLDLYGSYGLSTFREREYDPRSERYESVLGIQLSMDLFDGLMSRAERNERVLEASGLQKEALQTSNELTSQVVGAKAELKLTHELIHQSEDSIKRAHIYLLRTLDEYRRGVKNSPDVLSASERNLSMLRRFAELRRDYQLARSELLASLGK